jgi:hypothetical protein
MIFQMNGGIRAQRDRRIGASGRGQQAGNAGNAGND